MRLVTTILVLVGKDPPEMLNLKLLMSLIKKIVITKVDFLTHSKEVMLQKYVNRNLGPYKQFKESIYIGNLNEDYLSSARVYCKYDILTKSLWKTDCEGSREYNYWKWSNGNITKNDVGRCTKGIYAAGKPLLIIVIIGGIVLVLLWANRKPGKKERKITATKPKQKKDEVRETKELDSNLTEKITRLKKLYQKGILTKAEFEKAKDKLLK